MKVCILTLHICIKDCGRSPDENNKLGTVTLVTTCVEISPTLLNPMPVVTSLIAQYINRENLALYYLRRDRER